MVKKQKYIHGYDPVEQERLIEQARYLDKWVRPGVEFKRKARVLEVGCGVGAQTKILLKRFPEITIDGVDLIPEQLDAARHYLKREIKQGRVRLFQADAADLSSLEPGAYDGAFICWFLEHVKDPLRVLKETHGRLKKKAPVFVSEVFNQTFFVNPYSPALLKYWFEFNDHQWESGGNPFVGASLGHLLTEAGFQGVGTEVRPFHFDSRQAKERARFTAVFEKVLLSAAPELLKSRRVDRATITRLKHELARVEKAKDAVFFSAWVRGVGRA
ncbi:MAG: methyltransferase domain-containing protein [Cystobacter sp.]